MLRDLSSQEWRSKTRRAAPRKRDFASHPESLCSASANGEGHASSPPRQNFYPFPWPLGISKSEPHGYSWPFSGDTAGGQTTSVVLVLACLPGCMVRSMGNSFGSTLLLCDYVRAKGLAGWMVKPADQNKNHFPFPIFSAGSGGVSGGCMRLNSYIWSRASKPLHLLAWLCTLSVVNRGMKKSKIHRGKRSKNDKGPAGTDTAWPSHFIHQFMSPKLGNVSPDLF